MNTNQHIEFYFESIKAEDNALVSLERGSAALLSVSFNPLHVVTQDYVSCIFAHGAPDGSIQLADGNLHSREFLAKLLLRTAFGKLHAENGVAVVYLFCCYAGVRGDVSVTVGDRTVVIRPIHPYKTEVRFGSFFRPIRLPDGSLDDVRATEIFPQP